MSEQILLQGKILGVEPFLVSHGTTGPAAEDLFAGRSQWLTLISEVLPRALLAELGLARILLGSSGGGQFLLVLPGEALPTAEAFLRTAAAQIADLSSGLVKLIWGATDNLGDWAVIRRRINEQLESQRNAPLQQSGAAAFQPYIATAPIDAERYFAKEL